MIRNEKIIVTGAEGFIGSKIFNYLKSDNEVIGIDKLDSNESQIYKLNLTNRGELGVLIKEYNPSYVFHLGTNSASHYQSEFLRAYEEDSKSLINILDLIKENTKSKIIFMSSSYVYSNSNKDQVFEEDDPIFPSHNFGIAKLFFEKLIESNYKNSLIFRLCNVFGEGEQRNPTALNQWISESVNNKRVTVWGKGERRLQYVDMRDLTTILSRSDEIGPGIYNLGSNHYKSMYDDASLICRLTNSRLELKSEKKEGETLPKMSNTKLKNSMNFSYQKFEDSLIYNFNRYNTDLNV